MLGLAFAILNVLFLCVFEASYSDYWPFQSWTALAASLSLALPSGGSVAVIWGKWVSFLHAVYGVLIGGLAIGLVTAGVCNLCLAASMAEFLSAYPT